MKHKSKLAGILISLIGIFLLATPTLAGGWAAISLDALPGPVRTGETLHLGFVVRQHGMTPINSVSPVFSAVNRDSGETVSAEAKQTGRTGHFEVAVVFPSAGEWDWGLSVQTFRMRIDYDPITVLPSGAPASTRAASVLRLAMRWAGAGLLGGAALLAILGVHRRQDATAPHTAG